jgi:hypothetical protein
MSYGPGTYTSAVKPGTYVGGASYMTGSASGCHVTYVGNSYGSGVPTPAHKPCFDTSSRHAGRADPTRWERVSSAPPAMPSDGGIFGMYTHNRSFPFPGKPGGFTIGQHPYRQ